MKIKDINKNIVIIVLLLLQATTLVFLVLKMAESSKDNDESIATFENGYYKNQNDVLIPKLDYDILLLTHTKEQIDTLKKEEIDNAVDYYYNILESYKLNGYIGIYQTDDEVNLFDTKVEVLKLTEKYMPFTHVNIMDSSTHLYYCVLGKTKRGNPILAKYDKTKNNCLKEEKVCHWLEEKNSTSYIDTHAYCN